MDDYIEAKNRREGKWKSHVNSYEDIASTLADRGKELKQAYEDLEAQKTVLTEKNGGSDVADADILDINAGGAIVRVTRGTLTQLKGSILEAIFSGRWEEQLHRDSKGRIFLDANPTCFRCIVDYLNECKISPPDNQPHFPRVDSENQIYLDGLLTAFGLESLSIGYNNIDSSILNHPKHITSLMGFLSDDDKVNKRMTLLYRGARDGMNAESFHARCDNQGPTVSVVKSTDGFIFGGYTELPWTGQGKWKPSAKAFLFELQQRGYRNEPFKFEVSYNDPNAVYHDSNYGPTFGGGHDLAVMASDNQNYSYLSGDSYILPPEFKKTHFTGEKHFILSEVEVFKVDPSPMRLPPPPAPGKQPWQKLDVPENIRKSFEVEEACLLEACNELASLQESFDKEQEAIAIFCCQSGEDNIVLLDVSGHNMAVKEATLGKFPDSVLYKQFADPNWNDVSQKRNHETVREWSKTQVVAWSKKIEGLSDDVSSHFGDITGIELLVLGREDIKDLGMTRPGTVALVVDAIQKLRDQDDENAATFIEHSDYCFGKIIDHMRLKVMAGLGVPNPSPPTIREPDKQRFRRIVEFYFPTDEAAAEFLAAAC